MVPLHPLERPHFFTGQLLTAEDLRREQDYHRDKARLLNRFVHGWGVVHGLRVSGDGDAVTVSAGLALDCAGNELVLPREERLSLSGATGRQWVVVRYTEVAVGERPSSGAKPEPSSIREAVAVELSRNNPSAGHVHRVGCGESHGIALAVVRPRGTRWTLQTLRSAARCRR